jgi:hypothetical protein
MPGFLSNYEGVERIEFDGGYWIDVKKCLTHAELQWAQAKMGAGRQNVDMSGRQFMAIDMNSFQTELIVQSLADWNLDDSDETIWPLDAGKNPVRPGDNPYPPGCPRRQSVARLPAPVASKVFEVCDRLNGSRDKREAATFPDPDLRSGQDGEAGAAGTGVLPDQEGVLEPAGRDSRDAAVTPLA